MLSTLIDPKVFYSENDECYLAAAEDLVGCVADGETPKEAIKNLEEIVREWFAIAKEEGWDYPEYLEDFYSNE